LDWPSAPKEDPMDGDLAVMSREQLLEEVKRLRAYREP
jgi:hypothetical protein